MLLLSDAAYGAFFAFRDCHGKTVDLQDTVERAQRDAALPLCRLVKLLYGTR